MSLKQITPEIYIDPTEVSSIQKETIESETWGSGSVGYSFYGTVLTLKNGRKIFVKHLTPEQVLKKLNSTDGTEGDK